MVGAKALRALLMLGWLVALYEIPEGIAAPYAARLGGGPVATGLLIASGQIGAVLITPIFTRKVGPLTRLRWMGPMAVCTCVVLVATVFRPDLAISMAIFALTTGSGLRPSQRGVGRRPGDCFHDWGRCRRGGTSLDGHRFCWGTECSYSLRARAAMA